jgi:hypothetical protein
MRHAHLLILSLALSALAGCATPSKPVPEAPVLTSLRASRTTVTARQIEGHSKGISKDDLLSIMALVDRRPAPQKVIWIIYASDRNHVSIHLSEGGCSTAGPLLDFRRTSRGWVIEEDPKGESRWVI